MMRDRKASSKSAKPSLAQLMYAVPLILAACTGPSSRATALVDNEVSHWSSPPAAESRMPTVRIGSVANSLAFAPLFVALEKGYFAETGISIDYESVGPGMPFPMLLASGQLDVVVAGASAATLNAIERGVDIKVVSSLGRIPEAGVVAAIMVRKDVADSGQVRSLADLRGRTTAIPLGTAGGPAYEMSLLLGQYGLTLGDIEVVNLGFPEILAAFRNGAIDAAFLGAPFTTLAISQETAVILAPAAAGHSGVATLFGGAFIRERPEQAQAVILALVKAARDLQGDAYTSEAHLQIFSKYTDLPIAVLRAIDQYEFDLDLRPDTETILDMQRVFMEAGELNYRAPLASDRLVDGSFSEAAARRLAQQTR